MYGFLHKHLSDQMDRKQIDWEDSKLPTPCALWPVDLKLTHTDCNCNGSTLVSFQGQYATTCELDYNILQVEMQNVPKTSASVEVGDACLVEDLLSSNWYRGRVQNKSDDLFDVFLLDHGNILNVGPNNLFAIPNFLLMLPPKIVCGYFANVLPFQECWDQPSEAYFSSLIGRHIKGYIHGFLPCKILILEVPEITKHLLGFHSVRHVDRDTFLFFVELALDAPIRQSCESVPDLLIDKQTEPEISFKSSNVCGYKNILSLSGTKFAVGQMERVRIAAAVNPGLFYCQLSSAARDLNEMSKKLAHMLKSDYKDKSGENMGLLCAVKGKDEKWHRGLIQCLPINSKVRVMFVDYGYSESVKVENIFQLPSDFLLRPVMAFPCSLSCFGGKETKNQQQQQLGLLRNGLLGMELVLTIDDLSKEKCVCSVTLSNINECAPIKTLQCKEVDKMVGCDTVINVHRLSFITNESKKVDISKMPFEDIQDGAVLEGYVEYVQSPHDFWMRSAKSNNRFKAMMDRLEVWSSRLQLNEQTLQDPVLGQLCCAMYEKDMHYYRAVVVDILKYGAEVFFIDFGNTEKVPSLLIKKIPTEFTVVPGFVFNCSLAHVVPVEEEWTAAAADFFRKVTSDKAFLVHVIYRRSDVYVVEMNEKGFEKSESISTLLTSANMAVNWTYSVVKPLGTPAGKNKQLVKTFGIRQFAGNPSQKLPTKVLKHEINEPVDKQVQTDFGIINEKDIFKVHKFKPGTVISVQCSHISSPSDFWCQNKKYKSDLDRLMERLQTVYETNTVVLQPQSACCAVRLQLDNKWYRGCIFEAMDLIVKVFLVDYGIVVQEPLQKLRVLYPEFLKLEGQAFRCSLYNLTGQGKGDVWSDDAKTLLKNFTSGNSDLSCKIYSLVYMANKGFCNMVDLYTPFQQAATLLIERGLSKEIQSPKQLFLSAYPCSFVYSSLDITIGSEELVFPTYVVSPWEIYLQLDRNTEIIEQLMDRAMKESEALMTLMQTKHEFAHACSSVYLAKYSKDGKWYRAFVWPAQSSLHVNVFFVDYGGKDFAEKKNVLPIPMKATDLLLTPMQALWCSLLNNSEEELFPEVNTWLEKAILNKGLQAKFVATNSSGHFICELFDGELHINEKIREMFAIHRQNCKSVRKPISSCHKEVSSVANKFNSDQRPHVESVVKSWRASGRSNVIKGNGESCQKNSSKVKSHHLNDISAKSDHGKNKHGLDPVKQPQIERCTISKVQPKQVLPNLSDLPAIEIAPSYSCIGFISFCDSFKSFFIQMEKDEQNILKLREDLNSSPFTESVSTNVQVGNLVAARYDEDMALYRAAVEGVASSGFVKVEFVDYGNTATVDKNNIHPLSTKFLSQARLSTRCTLSKQCNQDDVESLLSDANDEPMMVTFIQNLGHAWEVSIQRLDLWHEQEVMVPNSDQAEHSQKQNTPVDEDNASLTSVCKITHGEGTASIKEGTKRLEHETKDDKAVPEKALKKQARRARGRMQTFRKSKKACTSKRKNDKRQVVCRSDFPQKIQIDVSVTKNKLLNISEPQAVKPKDQDIEIRRLFFAPVELEREYTGFAAAVTTPGKFNIALEGFLLIMIAVSNAFEDLPEDFAPLPNAHLIPGSGCMVKSEEKNKWCRAEIIQCDHKAVMVNLVDYGHCVHLSFQDVCRLKALPDELAAYPKLTFPCLLRGIKPADGLQWSDQAALFFQQCLYQNNLKIHFRQYVPGAQWEVDVITSNRNVAKELVDAGHAQYVDTVLGFQCHQGLGHKKETKSNSEENVHEAVTGILEQTQLSMEKVAPRNLEGVSLNNAEISEGCSTKEETEDAFGENCVEHGSAEKIL